MRATGLQLTVGLAVITVIYLAVCLLTAPGDVHTYHFRQVERSEIIGIAAHLQRWGPCRPFMVSLLPISARC